MVTATSVTDPAISASANITITPPVLADGTYVFRLSGEDSATSPSGRFFAAGAFSVVSGTITGGEQDFIDANGPISSTLGGSLGGTADGNFQITLTGTGAGVNGIETLTGNVVTKTNAVLGEFDSFATANGTLELQTTPVAPPSAGYAFEVAGLDGNSTRASVGLGGVLNIDGMGTISGNGSVFDINDRGLQAPLPNQTFAASTLTSPDAFGRVVFSLVPSSSSGIAAISLVGYVVNSQQIVLVETGDKFSGVMGGTSFSQGANTGTFKTASIAGASFVFFTEGEDAQGRAVLAGVFTTNADGTVSGTLNFNDPTGGSGQTPVTVSGTYTVDASGRVTLSNITGASSIAALQLYLSGHPISTSISMANGNVLVGPAFLQTGGPFSAASFSGTYSMIAHGLNMKNNLLFTAIGQSPADGVGAFTGTVDTNIITPPSQTTATPVSGAFTANPSGVFTGTLTGLDLSNGQNADSFTYYVVDKTRVIAIETDTNQLTLINFALHR